MKRRKRPDYTNSQIKALIAEHIHSERDRFILRRSLCDCISYERIAEEVGLSRAQIARIVERGEREVFSRINEL